LLLPNYVQQLETFTLTINVQEQLSVSSHSVVLEDQEPTTR
jgi:hypothetical protein